MDDIEAFVQGREGNRAERREALLGAASQANAEPRAPTWSTLREVLGQRGLEQLFDLVDVVALDTLTASHQPAPLLAVERADARPVSEFEEQALDVFGERGWGISGRR